MLLILLVVFVESSHVNNIIISHLAFILGHWNNICYNVLLLCLPLLQSLHRWRGGYPDRERECVPEEEEWRAPLLTPVPPPRSAVHPLLLWRSTAQPHASNQLKTLLSRHKGELRYIEEKKVNYFCRSKEGAIILIIFLIIILATLYMYI